MKIKFENLKRIYNPKSNVYFLTWLFTIEKETYSKDGGFTISVDFIEFKNSIPNTENNIFVIDTLEDLLKKLSYNVMYGLAFLTIYFMRLSKYEQETTI